MADATERERLIRDLRLARSHGARVGWIRVRVRGERGRRRAVSGVFSNWPPTKPITIESIREACEQIKALPPVLTEVIASDKATLEKACGCAIGRVRDELAATLFKSVPVTFNSNLHERVMGRFSDGSMRQLWPLLTLAHVASVLAEQGGEP